MHRSNGVRTIIQLPAPVGSESVRLLVFAKPANYEVARLGGALIVGGEDLIDPIIEGRLEFDRCIATQDMLPVVMKIARVLGPRGLMPNPKIGTNACSDL